jgi:hypothetical protein
MRALEHMRKYMAVIGVALASAIALAADSPRTIYQYMGLTLGGLSGEEIAMGCSCSFYSQESKARFRPLLAWSIEQTKPVASIFVEGQLEKLVALKGLVLSSKLNESVSCQLAGPKTKVTLALKTTAVCDGARECDGKSYEGTMAVTHGVITATVPVSGGCGC